MAEMIERNEVIKLQNISYSYHHNGLRSIAIRSSNCAFLKGTIYAVTGQIQESGPVLLMLMAGLIRPDSGIIYFNEEGMTAENTGCRRNDQISLVLKNCPIIPYLSVLDNAMLALDITANQSKQSKENGKRGKLNVNQSNKKVLELLATVGIDPSFNARKASALNQVQQQALAVVRALIAKPQLMLIEACDWSSCPVVEQSLLEVLVQSAHKDGICVVMTTESRIYSSAADEIWGFREGILLPLKIACP